MAASKFIPKIAFHPGLTLAEKLEEMKISIKEFALSISEPEIIIQSVINGERSVTPEMAIAFENVTKIPAHFWLNKQRSYDEYQVQSQEEGINQPRRTQRRLIEVFQRPLP